MSAFTLPFICCGGPLSAHELLFCPLPLTRRPPVGISIPPSVFHPKLRRLSAKVVLYRGDISFDVYVHRVALPLSEAISEILRLRV